MGPGTEHELEERFPGFAGGGCVDDPARRRGHHKYQFACGEEHVRGRRAVLRVKMGSAGALRVHGGGLEGSRDPGERDLPRERSHGILRSRKQRQREGAAGRRRGARSRGGGETEAGEFHERGAYTAAAEGVKRSFSFLLTITVTTTIFALCSECKRSQSRSPAKIGSSLRCKRRRTSSLCKPNSY